MVNPRNEHIQKELSLRLHSSLSAHRCTGYEINFRCTKSTDAFAEIVRWNGPFGDFSYLVHKEGVQYAIGDGDIIKGQYMERCAGGAGQPQTAPTRPAQPGMGIWLSGHQGAISLNHDYGLSSFMATNKR
jgi:hypothetical protein